MILDNKKAVVFFGGGTGLSRILKSANKAKKENLSIEKPENHKINKNQEFNNLIENWTETSQKILLILNKREDLLPKNNNAKSLIAYGAMSAHINMALQALKATEFNE